MTSLIELKEYVWEFTYERGWGEINSDARSDPMLYSIDTKSWYLKWIAWQVDFKDVRLRMREYKRT